MARDIVLENKSALNSRSSLLTALFVGAGVGFFGWLLMLAVNQWFLSPIFCRSVDTAAACTSSGATAWVIAHLIAALVSLFVLIRANIFRPLLVVLAALVTLWMVGLWFVPMVWWIGLLWQSVLFALAYALYAWLASGERFVYVIIAIVSLVVLFRVLISL